MSENTQSGLNDTMDSFSSADDVNSTNANFLNSNGIIAKVVFLILVTIVFIVVFYAIIQIIGYFYGPSKHILFLKGQVNANKKPYIYSQQPGKSDSATIIRSNNESTGIEFTWCVWLNYVSSIKDSKKLNPIFVKGDCNADTNTSSICSVNNGPGVYFAPDNNPQSNTIYILMDTINKSAAEHLTLDNPAIIVVENLPVGDYYHLAIRCRNSYIDVYINGTVVKTQNLMNVPKQNYYDLNMCPAGGFNGTISNLEYFNRSLTVVEINSIVQSGPNTTNVDEASFYRGMGTNGISTSWFNSFLR